MKNSQRISIGPTLPSMWFTPSSLVSRSLLTAMTSSEMVGISSISLSSSQDGWASSPRILMDFRLVRSSPCSGPSEFVESSKSLRLKRKWESCSSRLWVLSLSWLILGPYSFFSCSSMLYLESSYLLWPSSRMPSICTLTSGNHSQVW